MTKYKKPLKWNICSMMTRTITKDDYTRFLGEGDYEGEGVGEGVGEGAGEGAGEGELRTVEL